MFENYITIDDFLKGYLKDELDKKHGDKPSINEIFKILTKYYTGGRDINWLIKTILRTIKVTPEIYQLLKTKIKTNGNEGTICNVPDFLRLDINEVPEALLEGILMRADAYINKNYDFWLHKAEQKGGAFYQTFSGQRIKNSTVITENFYKDSLRFTSEKLTEEYSFKEIMYSIEEYKNNKEW